MTMLDDDRLHSLLGEAGAAFEVPATGADDIVARAAAPARGAPAVAEGPNASVGLATIEGEGEGGDGESETAHSEGAPSGRVRRLSALARRHPVLSAAACIAAALVVAGTIGAAVRASSPAPTLTSGLPHTGPLVPPSRAATTTIPRLLAPGVAGSSPSPKASGAPAFGAQSNGAHGTAGPAVTTPTAPPLPSGAVGQPAKIEQTGTLGLSVRRGALGHAMTQLNALAAAYGGFVASSQTQSGRGTGGAPYGNVTLQVPVDNFGAALKGAQALGRTSSLTTKSTDVTGQYVDLQARIAALEASRQQYLTILAKATTIGDVLAVQSQLDAIQAQIEQLQGQLQVLTSETTYSTLTVTVSEGAPPPHPVPLPESGLVRAWHDSTGGFLAGVEGAIRIAGPLLFALLCLAALALGGRALWRRLQRHNL